MYIFILIYLLFLLCLDVDECARDTDDCSENFKCVNKMGGYVCERVKCDKGYKLVGKHCQGMKLLILQCCAKILEQTKNFAGK